MSSSTADEVEKATRAAIDECFRAFSTKNDDPEAVLNRAFQDLIKDKDNAHVSADDIVLAMEHVLTREQVKETILQVTENEDQINCNEFIKIVKLLMKPTLVAAKILCRPDVKKVVLYGKHGVGKTWMAQKLAARATRKGEFDVAIWVYLNRIYEGLSLHESIAYQLSVLTAVEKSEAEDAKKRLELEKEKGRRDEHEEDGEEKKRERFEAKIRGELENKKLLLVLDNEGSKMELKWSHEEEKDGEKKLCLKPDGCGESIDLGAILSLNEVEFKVLITSANQPTGSDVVGLRVWPLSWDESSSLVLQRMDGVVKPDEIKELAEYFISRSGRLPAEILLIARVVSTFGRSDLGLRKLLEKKEILEKKEGAKLGDILIRGYDQLPKSVMIDCYSSETPDTHFLRRGGMVNFNELISYWIIEEHLGHFDRIEDAYEEGHRVLMELMLCGLLEKQEGDCVTPAGARFSFTIHERNDFYRRFRGGLGVTYDMRLGRVTWANGMIKTVSISGQEVQKPSALFLDGNFISEKSPADILFTSSSELDSAIGHEGDKKFHGSHSNEKLPPADSLFKPLTELENLVVFSPTGQHFQRLLRMKKLRLLVLRGCQYLDSLDLYFDLVIDAKHPPKTYKRSNSWSHPSQAQNVVLPPSLAMFHSQMTLTVLEISGPSLLSEIPESLFVVFSNLKTLNMSQLPIKKLPYTFYKLTKIEFLILRGCPSFEELGTLTYFKDLQTIDLSGSNSFTSFHDKSLHVNTKLQILNLSKTMIKTLPLINSNPLLKFISLKDCTGLQRIRQINKLKTLQIFDISGATQVEEFRDPSFEKLEKLKILDVSRTAITRLPANVCNPRYLYIQGCPNLERLPPVEDFTGAKVIDISGSSHLEEIRKEFFSNMKCLRELNLSKTSVKCLPFLHSLGCLRRLLLADCQHLEKLEALNALEKLEILDLSGCKNLMEIDDNSFEQMNCLQHLNISGVKLDKLPSLSKLMKLEELYVRDCPNVKELTGIEGLPVLNILDYSGTILKPTPSFSNPDRPRVLGVDIHNIDHQEVMMKLGARPDEVHKSTDQQNVEFSEEDMRQCKWSISAIVDENVGTSVYGSHFLQLLMKHPSLLSKNLSRFHFLVHPTEKEALLVADKMLYTSEVALRDIYFEQVSQEKMERCLEIREFDDVPPFLGYLLKEAQFVVLIDNAFFKSLLDLGVDNIMDMKACWIERCDQLEHVIAFEKKEDTKKPEKSTESKDDHPGVLAENKGDQTRESAISKDESDESSKSQENPKEPSKSEDNHTEELVKSEGKPEEPTISKDEPGEPANSQGEQKEVVDGKGEHAESAKSKIELGEPSKSKDELVEPASSQGEPGESTKSKDEPGEPANSQGEHKEVVDGKGEPGESAKSKSELGEPSKGKDEPGEPASSQDEPEESTKNKDETGKPVNDQGEHKEVADGKGEPEESVKSKSELGEPSKSKDEPGEPASSQGEPGESTKNKDETRKPANSQGEHKEVADGEGKSGESTKSKDETGESKGDTEKNFAKILDKLEILWISDVLNLKSIFKGDIIFQNLKSLYLEYCPQISTICSSSFQLQSLEILHVKYCQKLRTLFPDDAAQLNRLTELHLWGLDKLKRINYGPSLRTLRAGECPLLKYIIRASTHERDHQEFDGHPNLERLHIKLCDRVMTICEPSLEDASYFPELQELELSGLPQLKEIACETPSLRRLSVSECPSLLQIFDNYNKLSCVRIVEVKYCDELKTIFGVGGLNLMNLEKMELLNLPEVENFNGGELPPVSTGGTMIWGCPKLQDPLLGQTHVEEDARIPC